MNTDNRTELDKLHPPSTANARALSYLQSVTAAALSGNGIEMTDATFGPISVNELGLDQKMDQSNPGQPQHDDPVGTGKGAWANPMGRDKWYIGKERYDVLRWKDGRTHRTEVGFKKIAVDELFDGNHKPEPMVAEYLTPGVDGTRDEDEQPVTMLSRSGFRITVPIYAEAGIVGFSGASAPPPGVDGHPHAMWAPNGLWVTQQQDDGNFLTYELARPFDVGRFRAVWTRDGGTVHDPQWEGQ